MMTERSLYLKDNVLAEPLINQWYAWPYLLQPATAAMFIANSHLKILESFIANPQLHISALKNPLMLGGPFINYDTNRMSEIKSLLQKTKLEQSRAISLAADIKTLDETLAREASGQSLTSLYPKIPDNLKGFVELVYDANNNVSVRLLEGLIYKSDYYDTSNQSFSLSLIEEDNRSFVFSTPRLKEARTLHLGVPFNDKLMEELYAARRCPKDPNALIEGFGLSGEDADLFGSFFTEHLSNGSTRYGGDGIQIRYFGHACVLIETKSTSILIDPVISYRLGNGIPRYSFQDLPDQIDYVLITHNHQDHCLFETLLKIRHMVKNVIVPRSNNGSLIDPSLKLILENVGFQNVREVDEMECVTLPDGAITSVPFFGEHGDLNIRSKNTYHIRLLGKSIMFMADSNNVIPELYIPAHRILGDVDVLFLGMECDGSPLSWLYGPLLLRPLARNSDQSRRLNGSDSGAAINLVRLFNARHAYIYAMGQEPWLTFLTSICYTDTSRPIVESDKFVEYCRTNGIESERLYGKKIIAIPH
jgi:L-ascorbate metabolism protein UlaG (beta-lactamase superfamily)